jgi:hypothetical protein
VSKKPKQKRTFNVLRKPDIFTCSRHCGGVRLDHQANKLHNAIFRQVFPIIKSGVSGKAYTFLANDRRDLAAGVATPRPLTRQFDRMDWRPDGKV